MAKPIDPAKFNTLFLGFDALVPVVTVEFFFLDKEGKREVNEKGEHKAPQAIHIHENLAEAEAAVKYYNETYRGSACQVGHSFNMSLRDIMEKCQGYCLEGSDHRYYVLK